MHEDDVQVFLDEINHEIDQFTETNNELTAVHFTEDETNEHIDDMVDVYDNFGEVYDNQFELSKWTGLTLNEQQDVMNNDPLVRLRYILEVVF